MTDLTPREIVSELDRHIVGQNDAKRAVAVAMRNRWRRKQLPDELRDEVYPKNILMIGPTGVGKTEISRRLAKLARAPFLKVEATKFTEVGYVGRAQVISERNYWQFFNFFFPLGIVSLFGVLFFWYRKRIFTS